MKDFKEIIEKEAYNFHSELAREEIECFAYEGMVSIDEAETAVRTAETSGFIEGANFALIYLNK